MEPVPTDPAALKTWIASLSKDELMAVTQQMAGAMFTGQDGPHPLLESRNRAVEVAPPPDEPSLLTLTIELCGSEPSIWRRLSLPGDLTLDAVHTLLQAAMGWTDSHLHRFQPGIGEVYGRPYFVTELDEEEDDEGTHEDDVRLDQVLCTPGDQMTYLYDFGDGWEHRLTLESLAPLTPGAREPLCLDGAGSCPPEDVGGMHGHEQIAAWLRAGAPADDVPDPFEDAEQARGWLPPGYDPDAFDAHETTAAMRLWASGQHLPWHGLPEPLVTLLKGLRGDAWPQADAWLTALGPRLPVALDAEEVRRAARPWLAVLDAVGPRTQLTAAGYLPPVVVEQIAHTSGVMERWIGKANREDLTWPVAILRQNAQEVGLLRKAKGVLTPTARARSIAGKPRELVAGVLERLPLGKGFDAEAGWLLLLGLAAGDSGAPLDAKVAQLLTDRGWVTGDRAGVRTGVSAPDASRGSRPTLGLLESMTGTDRAADRDLLTRLARAALFGVTTE